MISRTFVNPVDATVPPVPLTWKNSGFAELPRFGGVRDEHGLQRAVLAAQALHRPEEKRLGELPIAIRHAARDVQHEEHHRVHRGLLAPRELPEAQVVIGECRAVALDCRGA